MPIVRVWFGTSGLFLSLYGVGCLLFLWVVFRSTAYGAGESGAAGGSAVAAEG